MLVLGQEDPKGPAMTLHTVGTQWRFDGGFWVGFILSVIDTS